MLSFACLFFALRLATASDECGLFLAESTIPGAGLGMFAGRKYEEKEQVTTGDVVIPLVEYYWHAGAGAYILWDEYYWNSDR